MEDSSYKGYCIAKVGGYSKIWVVYSCQNPFYYVYQGVPRDFPGITSTMVMNMTLLPRPMTAS